MGSFITKLLIVFCQFSAIVSGAFAVCIFRENSGIEGLVSAGLLFALSFWMLTTSRSLQLLEEREMQEETKGELTDHDVAKNGGTDN